MLQDLGHFCVYLVAFSVAVPLIVKGLRDVADDVADWDRKAQQKRR